MTALFLFGMLAGVIALMGWLLVSGHAAFVRHLLPRKFSPGAPIVYRMQAASDHPVHDASQVYPSERGESYYYVRKKYWRVEEVLQNGWIIARTALMEQHYLRSNDPNLRKASLLERLRYASRFPYI